MMVLLICAVIGYIIVDHNDAWYDTTIVEVTDIQTKHTETQPGVSIGKENYYVQSITSCVINGERAGEIVSLYNQYTDSGVRDERYRVGDKLFVLLGEKGETAKILQLKRDTLVYLMAVLLLLGMVAVAGKTGILAAISLVFNIGLLTLALYLYQNGWNILPLTVGLIFLFTTLSLLIANGWNRCSFLSILSALFAISVTAVIFLIVRACTPTLQYDLLEFGVVPDDLASLFLCEVMVGGLGAIMDVSISLISTADELLAHNPNIGYPQLRKSVRAVSDDIMGTMVNVLFFTYICGGLPEILLMFRNHLTVSLIWDYVLTFEMVRFLIGSIGLVLAIPASQFVLRIWMKRQEAAHG